MTLCMCSADCDQYASIGKGCAVLIVYIIIQTQWVANICNRTVLILLLYLYMHMCECMGSI